MTKQEAAEKARIAFKNKKVICPRCLRVYIRTSTAQKYCGNWSDKNSCSYWWKIERNKKNKWYILTRKRQKIYPKKSICTNCNNEYIKTAQNKNKCNICFILSKKEKRKLYRQKNRKIKIVKNKKIRKVRRLSLRFAIFRRDKFACCYCGRKAPNVILHIDHKYPKSRGGLFEENNLVTSCSECNLGKKDVILEEFNN